MKKPKSLPRNLHHLSPNSPKPRPNPRTTLATPQTPRKQRHSTLRYRNEPDTGNGIETTSCRSATGIAPSNHRNEPDTGNGIETLDQHLHYRVLGPGDRNEPDTGNGIETSSRGRARSASGSASSPMRMSQIPETGLRPFVVRVRNRYLENVQKRPKRR